MLKLIKSETRHCKEISLSECFINKNERLRFRELLYVPDNNMLRLRIIQFYYNNTIVGHLGRAKIFTLLRRNYYWPKNYSDIRKYVKFCQIYRRVKSVKHAFYNILKSLSVPNGR